MCLQKKIVCLNHAFDGDFRIKFITQNAFETALDGHCGMGAAAAGTTQSEFDSFTFDGNDFQVSAIGLQMDAEFFQTVSDFFARSSMIYFSWFEG